MTKESIRHKRYISTSFFNTLYSKAQKYTQCVFVFVLMFMAHPMMANVTIPDQFTLDALDNRAQIQFTDNGQVTVLHLWASWCGYCRREHSLWVNLIKLKHVKYISATYRESAEKGLEFLKQFPVAFDRITRLDDTNARLIKAKTVPDTIIICGNEIVYRHTGSMNQHQFHQIMSVKLRQAVQQCKNTSS